MNAVTPIVDKLLSLFDEHVRPSLVKLGIKPEKLVVSLHHEEGVLAVDIGRLQKGQIYRLAELIRNTLKRYNINLSNSARELQVSFR